MTPNPLTHERLAPLVGEHFTVSDGVIEVRVELTDASLTPGVPDGWPSTPFSLLFRGPLEPRLEQATYGVSHERLGTEDIFLVPIAANTDGVTYQAIFN